MKSKRRATFMALSFLLCISPSIAADRVENLEVPLPGEAVVLPDQPDQAGAQAPDPKLVESLAKAGHAPAQFNLGVMYDNGRGVPQDHKEAVRWSRLAAAQGYANAQSNLGAMYANGASVIKNNIVAYALFNIAAANGAATAAEIRTLITQTMTASEIEAGQDLSREMAQDGNVIKALDQYLMRRTRKK